jgi:tetratricopeptide (TPR) repeat protein
MRRHKATRTAKQNKAGSHSAERLNWVRSKFGATIALFLIVLTTFLVYRPALNGSQLWDDDANLTRPDLQSPYGLYRIWFDPHATPQYYPMVRTAFWLEHMLWGELVIGYHLVNVLWHVASVTLLYVILKRLKIPGALLAAAIFAVHPVMVESVAWMTEQKNTLSTVFYLSGILTYLGFDESRQQSRYWMALAFFALALLSKTATVTLPFALLVIFWWQRGMLSLRRDVVPLIPFVALGIATGLMTVWAESTLVGADGTSARLELTFVQRCLIASRDIWFYLGKLILPTNLSFVYERWTVDPTKHSQWIYLIAVLVTTLVLWTIRKRWRGPLAGWLYFCGTLGPVLGFFDVFMFRYSFVADHLQYLASLGPIVSFSGVVAFAIARAPEIIRWAGVAISVVLVSALAAMSWQQSHIYNNAITLYEATLQLNPDAWMAHNNLATELANAGDISNAIEHYREALRIRPNLAATRANIGSLRVKAGQYTDGIDELQGALKIEPDSAETHNWLGNAFTGIGRKQDAIREYREAIRLDPDFFEAYHNLGLALMQTQKLHEAVEQFRHALRLQPNDSDARNSLGSALNNSGQLLEAIDEYRTAVDLNPDNVLARYNLGNALIRSGRGAEAIDHLQHVLRLKPDMLEAHISVAKALALADRSTEAIAAAEKAIQMSKSAGRDSVTVQMEQWLEHYRLEVQRAAATPSAPPMAPTQ